MLGESYLKLMSLAYLLDNPNELIIVGNEGQIGTLVVDLVPCDSEGNELTENHSIFDSFVDDPKALLGK